MGQNNRPGEKSEVRMKNVNVAVETAVTTFEIFLTSAF
jgi:hypothetical protein